MKMLWKLMDLRQDWLLEVYRFWKWGESTWQLYFLKIVNDWEVHSLVKIMRGPEKIIGMSTEQNEYALGPTNAKWLCWGFVKIKDYG